MKRLFTLLLAIPFIGNAQYVVQGISSQSGNTFILNAISQSPYAGRVFNTTAINLNNDFDIVFNSYLGNVFNNGFAFLFLPGAQPTSLYPATTISTDNIHNFGTGSISTDFVIEFDIRGSFCAAGQNVSYEPTSDINHVSYWKNNSSCNFGNYFSPYSALGTVNYYAFEPYRIKWTKASNTLETYYNNVLIKSNVIDLVGLLGSNVYWGFSAACYCVSGAPQVTIVSINGQTLLPLTISSFTAEKNNNLIKLNWKTAQEQNTSHFIIEKSIDGNNFSYLYRVEAGGNSNTEKIYSATDPMPVYGTNFYRLKMVDLDGKYSYSKIVSMRMNDKNSTVSIFPNPVDKELRIQVNSSVNQAAVIKIMDMTGRILSNKNIDVNAQTISTTIDVAGLQPGIYQLIFQQADKKEIKQFVKQ